MSEGYEVPTELPGSTVHVNNRTAVTWLCFPQNCLVCRKLYHTADTYYIHMLGKLVGDGLEPMVVTCNIGSVQHLVGEEQIRFIHATGARGAALALQQSIQYMTWCLCLRA